MKNYSHEWPEREWAKDKEIDRLRAALKELGDAYPGYLTPETEATLKTVNEQKCARRLVSLQ